MHKVAHRIRAVVLTCGFACIACTDRTVVSRQAETSRAQHLAGIWELHMRLDHSLSIRAHTAEEMYGELALLPNPWVVDAYPEIATPTNYGTYNADFSVFGFDPREAGQVPVAIAVMGLDDSVEVVLEPGRSTTVMLHGIVTGDSVRGRWDASVFHFGCAGTFSMVKRTSNKAISAHE